MKISSLCTSIYFLQEPRNFKSAHVEFSLNNSDKGAVSHAIFHRALWEYLSQVNEIENEELQEKMRRSVFEGCVVPQIDPYDEAGPKIY